MVTYMKDVAKLEQELTIEEHILLSVAYKNIIDAQHVSWRIVSSIEQQEEVSHHAIYFELVSDHK
ncbi:hypothetical protein MJO28_006375 [Puccinia striiformis f. sp. tritici]|uniref:Uncharacterized protein n=1 Tax=Puccinia striiformis f. sp. tritici TaxID=168172 RepID=A0ACC0EH95_9BASI|nr:hypothetical protein MJO28_006375 [Puccinia striiformis f. sp. tritici]